MRSRPVSGAVVGKASGRPLQVIAGRRIWNGDAVAISSRPEAGVDSLMPLSIFRFLFVCNSSGHIIFR